MTNFNVVPSTTMSTSATPQTNIDLCKDRLQSALNFHGGLIDQLIVRLDSVLGTIPKPEGEVGPAPSLGASAMASSFWDYCTQLSAQSSVLEELLSRLEL